MTMRNAVPRFGMRAAVVLAVLAVVALAALLAVRSPASAQSLTATEIWSATMTVGNFPLGKGYDFGPGGRGSLSDRTFSSGPNLIAFNLIIEAPAPSKKLTVAFGHKFDDNELRSLILVFPNDALNFADSTHIVDSNYGHAYSWPKDPLFGWADGDTVTMSITAFPVIAIEAVTTTVEYGGNGNAAESTAEFRFTRYGSTENELSFRVTNRGIFTPGAETVRRKFTAGQSSFSNFHWAVDVDSNGDPVCLIVWNVRSGNDYLEGTPSEARVVVAGPGTTCQGGM